MAVVAVLTAMNGDGGKSLHPFFRQTNGSHEHITALHDNRQLEAPEAADQPDGAKEKPSKGKKSRKTNGLANGDGKGKKQKTLQDIVNPKASTSEPAKEAGASEAIDLHSSEPVVDRARRKRRRTSEHESMEVGDQVAVPPTNQAQPPSSPRVVIPASSPLPQRAPPANADTNQPAPEAPKTPPKKVLRLTGNGKFSSPVSKKAKPEDDEQAAPGAGRRRGRPRKSKEASGPRQLIVKLAYNTAEAGQTDIGNRISRVLLGEERVATEQNKPSPRKLRTPKKPKTTHPFFTGKPLEPPPAPKQESPRKTSATTPGKLRRQVYGDRLPETKEVPYAIGSDLLRDRQIVRHPGAKDPPWPDRQQAHVRGLDGDEVAHDLPSNPGLGSVRQRKRKAAQLPFPLEESVLRHVASGVTPEEDQKVREDGFCEPHSSVRLPRKLLIPGREIRQKIAPELSVALPVSNDAEDDLSLPHTLHSSTHPALQKLWNSMPGTLTGFDMSRGETLGWAQKYAPSAAAEILQPSREMSVLKDWLTSLTVTAVESTTVPQTKHAAKVEPKAKKKRRRKPEDLDDFLVDSDEDICNMDELTDPEDVPTVSGSKAQRSVIQVAADGLKLSNAVLLSGPNGCGKTAAAYAVANELGFKVFEISPHERRSGKDVLDKVGNMTENHLVKHHGLDAGELSSAEEPNKVRLDEAFERDLASGRQGKMNAFFKPAQAKAKHKPPKQKAEAKAKVLEAVQQAIRKPPKDQQQSLVLLEEVDILFKDDKEFWPTVLKLIATSKRPFIMTCNDEDLVPLQAMSLHAILRLSPPPLDLAADYMLLIAAAEGHLLKRGAVASLYQGKGCDLRASIAELDLWCQMGIGDPRGGLGWIYQRWPPGSDVDERGRKLRIVSEGTYHSGMGLPESTTGDEEKMLWAWQELGLHPTRSLEREGAPLGQRIDTGDVNSSNQQRRCALKSYEAFANSLSCTDFFTSISIPETAPLDTTEPMLLEKARNQYIAGLPLLQTDESIDHSDMGMQLMVASMCALSRVSPHAEHALTAHYESTIDPNRHRSSLLSRHRDDTQRSLTRNDFACFDAISVPPDNALSIGTGLTQSAFDGPLEPIAIDLAPYVRSIVQYDMALEEQRQRLSMLIADGGGRKAKRARTTRAARSALEGGQRASTRRERWFTKGLDLQSVLATGGSGWPNATLTVPEAMSADGTEAPASSTETA